MVKVNRDFENLRERTHGMMPTAVYERIYGTATALNGRDVVEVGTGHGAGAISAGLGLVDAGHGGRIFTLDKLEGGSRAIYGGRGDNQRIVESNLAGFGVDSVVTVLVAQAKDLPKLLPPDLEIGMIILDADGRVDRDLLALWPRLADDAVAVIDDYDDRGQARRTGWGKVVIEAKFRMTFEVTNRFLTAGLLELEERIGNTAFLRRTAKTLDSVPDIEAQLRDALATLAISHGVKLSVRARSLRRLRDWSPQTYYRLRRAFRR